MYYLPPYVGEQLERITYELDVGIQFVEFTLDMCQLLLLFVNFRKICLCLRKLFLLV